MKNVGGTSEKQNLPAKSEFLIYQSDDGKIRLDVRLENESIWLTQAMMADLFQVKPQNITMHLKNVYAEGELSEAATCKDFLQVQMQDWIDKLDDFLKLSGRNILTRAGAISHDEALLKAHAEYEKFHAAQLELPTRAETDFLEVEAELKQIESKAPPEK